MIKAVKGILISAVSVVTALGFTGSVVLAHNGDDHAHSYQANLSALNKSDSTGTAMVKVNGNQVTVMLRTSSASPNLPHAQHIHIGGQTTCPTNAADKDKDGFTTTVEGQPFYGDVKVSLTTSGDTSADSALAVDRFPTADASGNVNYERTFTLPEGVSADALKNSVIVQHGISELFEDKAKYDGEKKSSLKEDLPLEATIPAACGKLVAAPVGGAGTGSGSTAGTENASLITTGAVAMVAAGALFVSQKRSEQ